MSQTLSHIDLSQLSEDEITFDCPYCSFNGASQAIVDDHVTDRHSIPCVHPGCRHKSYTLHLSNKHLEDVHCAMLEVEYKGMTASFRSQSHR
jgi:hypothetical protein